MDVCDAIRNRRSIRVYRNNSIESEKLDRILEAARLAPSARNMQERKFVVVRDRETKLKLMAAANNQSFVAKVPVVIAACGTITDYVMSCGQLAYTVDVAIALDHMTLQAVEDGLGTCWVCAFSEAEVKTILEVPDNIRVVALLTVGYPAENPEPRVRKETDEITCYESYKD